jgi:hypothetical protein
VIGRIIYLILGTACLLSAPVLFVASGSIENARDNALLIEIAMYTGIGFMIAAVSFGVAEGRRRQPPPGMPPAAMPPMGVNRPVPSADQPAGPQQPWGPPNQP